MLTIIIALLMAHVVGVGLVVVICYFIGRYIFDLLNPGERESWKEE